MSEAQATRREPQWLVGLVGLFMLWLGTWAVIVALRAGWFVAVGTGAALLLAAWRMRPSATARSLRLILAGLGVVSMAAAAFCGLAGLR